MAAFEELSDEILEDVVGDIYNYINMHSEDNAVIRKGPGTNYKAKTSLENGTRVWVDEDSGVYVEGDRTWYRVSSPVSGWVLGRSVGLPELGLKKSRGFSPAPF